VVVVGGRVVVGRLVVGAVTPGAPGLGVEVVAGVVVGVVAGVVVVGTGAGAGAFEPAVDPGCSRATVTPMKALTPPATTIAVLVSLLMRLCARARPLGEYRSRVRLTGRRGAAGR
jgi:hypothetical protein